MQIKAALEIEFKIYKKKQNISSKHVYSYMKIYNNVCYYHKGQAWIVV